jgi:hypothetical protein
VALGMHGSTLGLQIHMILNLLIKVRKDLCFPGDDLFSFGLKFSLSVAPFYFVFSFLFFFFCCLCVFYLHLFCCQWSSTFRDHTSLTTKWETTCSILAIGKNTR